MTVLYPPIFSTDDCKEEKDAFIPYVSPLKAERMSSLLRVRALSTPSKKAKRSSRSILDSAKRLRAHRTYYTNVSLKNKVNDLSSSGVIGRLTLASALNDRIFYEGM